MSSQQEPFASTVDNDGPDNDEVSADGADAELTPSRSRTIESAPSESLLVTEPDESEPLDVVGSSAITPFDMTESAVSEPAEELASSPPDVDEEPPAADGNRTAAVGLAPGRRPRRAKAEAPIDEADEPLTLSLERVRAIVESLLFAADRPLTVAHIVELLGNVRVELPPEEEPASHQLSVPGESGVELPSEPGAAVLNAAVVRVALGSIRDSMTSRGFTLHEVAGGFILRTHPDSATWVQRLLGAKPAKLSRATLEALSIVAYRQPITRPEIDEIRGVDSGGALKTLLEKGLLRIVGKKEEPGRPLLYGTTKEFLTFFQLRDLRELPSLREFHELVTEETATSEQAMEPGAIAAGGQSATVSTAPISDHLGPKPAAPVDAATNEAAPASDAPASASPRAGSARWGEARRALPDEGGREGPPVNDREGPPENVNDGDLERDLLAAIAAAEAASLPFRTITETPAKSPSATTSKSQE